MSFARRAAARLPLALGGLAVVALVPLVAWDVASTHFPAGSHDLLGAAPLFAIAAAYLAQQMVTRPPAGVWLRAAVVVLAFLAWGANQYWPEDAFATGWNDVAIALFVVDIFLSVAAVPAGVVEPATAGPPAVASPDAAAPDGGPDGVTGQRPT